MSHLLDDASYVTRNDPKGMLRLTSEFPGQCRQALEIAQATPLNPLGPIKNALLTGLGGSAAGGDFVKALFDDQAAVPFVVNRDYHLPNWVDEGSLVFVSSYSGNTEETISAYHDAVRVGARRIVLTSGGKLAELARENGDDLILIPAGQPPRTALGFMLVPLVVASARLGLIPAQDFDGVLASLDEAVRRWGIDRPFSENDAKQLGEAMHGTVSVLYGLGGWQAIVANRWKGQINENAKNMTFANAFPELNHNEILGWVRANEQRVGQWLAVVLEDGSESAKMQARRDVTARLIHNVAPTMRVHAFGATLLARMLTLVLMGDFVSLYLAALNDVDPENIDSINVLKSELSRIPE